MSDSMNVIRNEIQEISGLAGHVLGLVSLSHGTANPVRYQSVIRGMAQLRDMWKRHVQRRRDMCRTLLSPDDHLAGYLGRLENEALIIQERLDRLSAAGWPRSTQLGLHSCRLRTTETLHLMLRQLEHERTRMLPLLERWTPVAPMPPRTERELTTAISL